MAKDPAFLFYSKDWLEGTADLMPDEKGVYVDLLCHQHQKGFLPSDTKRLARLAGLSHEDFLKIWQSISSKFSTEGERTLNRKLNDVMNERSTNAFKNKIIGIFSAALRGAKISEKTRQQIRKLFKVEQFIQESNETVNERINEWFNERISSLEDGDAIEDVDIINKEPAKKIRDYELPEWMIGDVLAAWEEWEAHRKAKRSKITPQAAKLQFKFLGGRPPDEMIKLITNAIEKNWSGLYELKSQNNDRTTTKGSARGADAKLERPTSWGTLD